MFKNLDIFRTAHALATHSGARQGVIATNIANADTPGFKAQDVEPFADFLSARGQGSDMKATRPTHLNASDAQGGPTIFRAQSQEANPNGNTVSMEEQMVNAVDVKRQHDKALAIYRSGLSILRSSLGRN